VADKYPLYFIATTASVKRALCEIATKIASEYLANAGIRRQFAPVLLGYCNASIKMQVFRDRN
jgi:hypothetical protein